MKEIFRYLPPDNSRKDLFAADRSIKKYAGDAVPIFRGKSGQSYHGKYDDADNG